MEYLILLYLTLPAFMSNMAPILAMKYKWFEMFNTPLDIRKKMFGKRILGENKTVRGLLVGTLFGGIAAIFQWFIEYIGWIDLPYLDSIYTYILFGLLAGFGALFGDAVGSFIKRQIGIKSGRPFLPLDQIDYILGYLLFSSIFIAWNWNEIIFLLIAAFVLNITTNIIGYFLGIKNTYW